MGGITRLAVSALLVALPVQAQIVRQLTDVRASDIRRPRLTDDGTMLFVAGTADPVGLNPEHRWQIFRVDLQTGNVEQISTFPSGIEPNASAPAPAVSDDGQRIAFVSRDDLTGFNADRGPELFVMSPDGTGLLQLTNGPASGVIGRVEISGSGHRIVFGATFDYAGQNPDGKAQVFVVDADGTNLAQLSTPADGGYHPSISDDGERVVYAGATLRAVEADGSDPRALTSWYSWFPTISGNGSTVIFLGTGDLPNESPGWCIGGTQVGAVDWDGSNPKKLSGLCLGDVYPGWVEFADVTDDGRTVFYVGVDLFSTIWRVSRDATEEALLAGGAEWFGAACRRIGVAGGGARIGMTCEGGDMLGTNPDLGLELFSADADGNDLVQHTDSDRFGHSTESFISADSGHVVFVSDANLLNETPPPGPELYGVNVDGSGLQRLTDLPSGEPKQPVATADGSLIVFSVQEPYGELHRLYTANPQTGDVHAITGELSGFHSPDIDDGGSWIVARKQYGGIYKMAPDGTGLTELTQGEHPGIDGLGRSVVFTRSGEVRLVPIAGTAEQLLASGQSPDISRAGDRVAYVDDGDPCGTNPDGNREIFLVETDSLQVSQLTFTDGIQNLEPAISGDGNYVYYQEATAGYVAQDFKRVHTTTLEVERVSALQPCALRSSQLRPITTNHDGSLAVFHGGRDCAGENPDGNFEILLIDRNTPPALRLGPAQPTRLTWDAESGPYFYDAIRGDLAQVRFSASGVDLGTVVCLENDSADNTTLGAEDPDLPAAGEALFYLVRGLPGGNYGRSSSGKDRSPAVGDCP